jgi:hypothetical protein
MIKLHQSGLTDAPPLPRIDFYRTTIDHPASPDHLFQPSWVGAEPAPD